MLLCNPVDNTNELIHILIANRNLHSLSAQYIRRSDKYRIAQFICRMFRLFRCKYGMSGRSWNAACFQNPIKQFPILRRVHVLRRSAQNRHAHFQQRFRQLNRCLAAELYHCSVRLLNSHNTLHILRRQRLKIQFIRNIKVCTHRFRVIIDDNSFKSFFGKRPGTMD